MLCFYVRIYIFPIHPSFDEFVCFRWQWFLEASNKWCTLLIHCWRNCLLLLLLHYSTIGYPISDPKKTRLFESSQISTNQKASLPESFENLDSKNGVSGSEKSDNRMIPVRRWIQSLVRRSNIDERNLTREVTEAYVWTGRGGGGGGAGHICTENPYPSIGIKMCSFLPNR